MQDKRIVVIGGGLGTEVALSGLKRYTSDLTALVSTFDANSRGEWHGTGSGNTPVDEVRSSLVALGPDQPTTQIMERLFSYKLSAPAERPSSTFGSLFLSTLTEITGTVEQALKAAARMLNVQGQVLPVTLDYCPLVAELRDEQQVLVTTPAELIMAASHSGLRQLTLQKPAKPLGTAIQAVREADIILLGPADLHFNILAPLQLDGFAQEIAASKAVKIFVCNILTQPSTTDGWPASRFIRVVMESLGGPGSLDYVIVNSTSLPVDALAAKAANGYFPVLLDLEECLSLKLNVIVRPVASPQSLCHDTEKLARTIVFLGGGRTTRKASKRDMFPVTHDVDKQVVDNLFGRVAGA